MEFNGYGVPIMTDEERIALHKYLLSFPCTVCHAKLGTDCRNGKRKIKDVHMGRLFDGFDSVVWLEQYRAENLL